MWNGLLVQELISSVSFFSLAQKPRLVAQLSPSVSVLLCPCSSKFSSLLSVHFFSFFHKKESSQWQGKKVMVGWQNM